MAITIRISARRSRSVARRRTLAAITIAGLMGGAVALAGPAAAEPVSGSTSVPETGSEVSGVSGSTPARPAHTAAAVPAAAAGESYVALGDSYSSGTGTRTYIDDGTDCLRSTHAYPSLIASANNYALDFRACSGAVVADVRANQLAALSAATDVVTISIGGNDADFTGVITECAKPGWMSNCDAAIDAAQTFINSTLPSRLSGLYSEISSAAPHAEVVVAGYPRLFMGEDCNALTWISPAEMTRLNATADLLNATTRSRAQTAGFGFADPTSPFTGHAVCDDPAWINGLSNPIVESNHPNTAGHAQGYTPIVGGALGASTAVTPAVIADAESRAQQYAEQQAPYAAYDSTIQPSVIDVAPLNAAADAIASGEAAAE